MVRGGKAQGVELAREWAKILGSVSQRRTEKAAFISWETGYVPGWAWSRPTYGEADDLRNSQKCCPECGQYYKLDSEHWHKNSYGKRGWHSICKDCRCKARRQDYRRKVVLQ
jgi:hypothetical protein